MSKKHKSSVSAKGSRNRPWLFLSGVFAAAALIAVIMWPGAPATMSTGNDIIVYKTASCSCCGNWVAHLRDAGLKVGVVNVRNTQAIRSRAGVPRKLGSCHTAVAGDYWVEGHVPADIIQRLVAEKPDGIRGIAVPGMPIGSPGMEGQTPVEYDIVAYDSLGDKTVYATRMGRSEVPNQ